MHGDSSVYQGISYMGLQSNRVLRTFLLCIALQQVGVKDCKYSNATKNTRMKQGFWEVSYTYNILLTWRSIGNYFIRYVDSVVVRK